MPYLVQNYLALIYIDENLVYKGEEIITALNYSSNLPTYSIMYLA